MAVDAHKNFAYSTVAVAPSPATSGATLTVATGEGTRYPAVPFNATVCPVGFVPIPTNAEIVRVTNITGDVLTITRTQESTSARTIVVGDAIYASITVKTLTDVELGDPVTVPHGGTGDTTLAAHGVLIGAGAGAVAVTSPGSSGQVLTSTGPSSDPTMQNVDVSSIANGAIVTILARLYLK